MPATSATRVAYLNVGRERDDVVEPQCRQVQDVAFAHDHLLKQHGARRSRWRTPHHQSRVHRYYQ